MNDQIARAFNSWVNRILSEHPMEVAAYNFNLYEHDRPFAIQLIGAARFDSDDPSWPCDEAFSSGDDLFEVPHEIAGSDWQDGLATAKQLITNYAHSGAQREKLKAAQGVGVGFVDGDIDLVVRVVCSSRIAVIAMAKLGSRRTSEAAGAPFRFGEFPFDCVPNA